MLIDQLDIHHAHGLLHTERVQHGQAHPSNHKHTCGHCAPDLQLRCTGGISHAAEQSAHRRCVDQTRVFIGVYVDTCKRACVFVRVSNICVNICICIDICVGTGIGGCADVCIDIEYRHA